MKKLIALCLMVITACFVFAGCADPKNQLPPKGNEIGNQTEFMPEQPSESEKPTRPFEPEQPEKEKNTKMFLTVNGNKIEVTLAENSSVDALVELLKQGDITYTANDYGGFEKVGSLGHDLPINDSQITTQPGDVILYSGNRIVLFYGSNSWSYTRLGKISGYSVSELRSLLDAGNGSVQVTIGLC